MNNMIDSIYKPLEYVVSNLFEGISDLIGDRGEALQNGSGDRRVTLPDDLFAHSNVQTEWWYYTGHCRTDLGREFGFELVFFKRRTDLDRLGIFPVRALANPMYFAHFAISDLDNGRFDYRHMRSFGTPFEIPVSMSTDAFDLRLGDWSIREVADKHILHANINGGIIFDAVLESRKPVVLNGDDGSGVSKKSAGASNHFSFTRMSVSGRLTGKGRSEKFDGVAWMDREFGTWEQTNWDWFSIQFDDETELMIYQYRGEDDVPTDDSNGTFVDAAGNAAALNLSDYSVEVTGWWTSPNTGTRYPAGWRATVPSHEIDIEITPRISDQELDTRGTTMIIYWEGACSVSGTRAGTPISGHAYVELVGYDRSHENTALSEFLFTEPIRKVRESLEQAAFARFRKPTN